MSDPTERGYRCLNIRIRKAWTFFGRVGMTMVFRWNCSDAWGRFGRELYASHVKNSALGITYQWAISSTCTSNIVLDPGNMVLYNGPLRIAGNWTPGTSSLTVGTDDAGTSWQLHHSLVPSRRVCQASGTGTILRLCEEISTSMGRIGQSHIWIAFAFIHGANQSCHPPDNPSPRTMRSIRIQRSWSGWAMVQG